ncbi:MAG: two pore domain potassium channel family protein [Actinobacteria bacterium]|nr:two pore domain potassium channel family protein [Actinomycetota bacterium]
MAASPADEAARIVTVLLEGLTLMATLLAARAGRLLFRVAGVAVVGAVVAAVVSAVLGYSSEVVTGWFFAINVLLVGAAPVAIVRALYRRTVVDVRTVLGAVCVYLLIGILFAFVYASLDGITGESFFVQTESAGIQTFLYFSFTTQTTVGYGDYTAATNLGRTLATTEALLGQIYLVTVIALLVSRMTVTRREPQRSDDPGSGAEEAPTGE